MTQNAALDKAFKLFNEKQFDQAKSAFEALIADEGTSAWIRVRLQQFHKMAEAQKQPGDEGQPPALLAIAHHMNAGNYEQAAQLIGNTELPPGDAAYLKAEIAIEQGQVEEALGALQEAIAHNPDNRGYALNAPSFAEHIKSEAFEFLRTEKEGDVGDTE